MESLSKELQTKLDKVKAFMDPGTFLFTFEGAKPLAIHESQLFKNQLVEEAIDEFGNLVHTPKFDTVIKRERITDIKVDHEGIGFLLSSGKLSIPKSLTKDDYDGEEGVYKNIVITPPKFHYELDNSYEDDKISYFGFTKSGDIVTIYILTELHQIYKYTLENGVLSEPTNINSWFTYRNDENTEDIKYVLKGLYTGDNSVFVTTSEGYLFIDPSEKTQHLFNVSAYAYDKFIKIQEIDTRDVKKIYCQYGKCYFLYKNGYVKCTGKNPSGSLGTGNSDEKHELSFLGCELDPAVTESSVISGLQILHVKDIAIGPQHTVFLLDNYKCIGFGSNEYYQLGQKDGNKEYITEYAEIKFPDYVKGITATDLGTIALSVGGKLMYCGIFLNHELTLTTSNLASHEKNLIKQADGTYKWVENTETTIEPSETITVNYTKNGEEISLTTGTFLRSEKPVRIMRTLSTIYDNNGRGSGLLSTLWCKLYNTTLNGVLCLKEDGRIYYSGDNYKGIIGPAFGYGSEEKQDVLLWTSLESQSNDLGRISEPRISSWTYYDDIVAKRNKNNGYGPKNVYYKNRNGVWIDWVSYFSSYKTGADYLIDPETENHLPKIIKVIESGETLFKTNYESFEKYAAQESIEKRYGIDKSVLPSVTYIDSNLLIYDINACDNRGQRIYNQNDADKENIGSNSMLSTLRTLLQTYIDTLDDETISVEEKNEIRNIINNINKEIEDYKALIKNNENKIGSIINNYNFAEVKPIIPNKVLGFEEKTITNIATEFDENGNTIEVVGENGVTAIKKLVKSEERQIAIQKVDIEPVNIEYYLRNREQPASCMRGDLKLTIHDEENEKDNFSFSDVLVWLNGSFPVLTKMDNDDKIVGISSGLSIVPSVRMCEHPNEEVNIRNNGRATVDEKSIPSELRLGYNLRLFSWEDIEIQSPVSALDRNYFNGSSYTFKKFKYGTFTFDIISTISVTKIFEKGEFMLLMNGVIIPDSEYEVEPIYGVEYSGDSTENVVGTKIILKSYWDYVAQLVRETVDLGSKGAKATVEQLAQTITGNMFTFVFFKSKRKYKKVKLYYDRQCIRNCPRPGNITFSDIGYNELIVVDGHYLPYLWVSHRCIKYPDTINTIRDPENDFINYSDIYKIKPYFVNKKANEFTEDELYSFLIEALGYEEEVARALTVEQVRGIVANSLKNQ